MDAELPVNTVMEILRLQSHAEVITNDYGALLSANRKRGIEQIHIRGGRAAETALMINGMQMDYSWNRPAKIYTKLYKKLQD